MKTLIVVSFLFLSATATEAQSRRGGKIHWRHDHDSALRDAKRLDKPIIIYITVTVTVVATATPTINQYRRADCSRS